MWDFIYKCLIENHCIVLSDINSSLDSKELISFIDERSKFLAPKIRPKMKCAVLCKNELNMAVAVLLCWRLDMVPILMSFNYGKDHYTNIINLTDPDLIFTDMDYRSLSIDNISLYNLLTGNFIQATKDYVLDGCLSDVAVIMCTSGTSGKPKGVMITENGLIKNIINIASYFKVSQNQTIVIARPLYHSAVFTGEFLLSLYSGLKVYFLNQIYNPFRILYALENKNANVLCGTPTLFRHLSLYMNKHQINSQVNKVAISGECLTKETALNIRKAFPKTDIYSVYGLTEAGPRVSWLPPSMFDMHSESVGIPLNEIEIRIGSSLSDESNQPFVKGEIFVKSPSNMKGYYKDKISTNKVLKEGWLATGDVGYIDNNSFLYICSRADDMIIKAGMNIYPKEIEDDIRKLDIISDVVAYGVKTNNGDIIAVNVIVNETTNKKSLLNLFSTVLPNYKMPSKVEIVTEFEKTASGKTIRPKCDGIGSIEIN